ncbi:MAG: hypothetical protein ABSF22_03200, partial [Bryobacteraceae bacterium]
MSDNFKIQCTRRFVRKHPVSEPWAKMEEAILKGKEPLGAGSGGDPGDGGHSEYHDGQWALGAAQLSLCAEGSTGDDAMSPVVSILAGMGMGGSPDGIVSAHGSQGVRISSGPPKQPAAMSTTVLNGVQIEVGTAQEIIVRRGVPAEQTIQISPGLMVVDSPSQIIIQSATEIELCV